MIRRLSKLHTMRQFSFQILCLALLLGHAPQAHSFYFNDDTRSQLPSYPVIYGEDQRQDIYQISDELLLKLASATAAVVPSEFLIYPQQDAGGAENLEAWTQDLRPPFTMAPEPRADVSDLVRLDTLPYSSKFNLCRDEPFFHQSVISAQCSGTLVGPNLILTAGHCIRNDEHCKQMSFVFDFQIKKKGAIPQFVPHGSVYRCAKVIARVRDSWPGADWALLKTDRQVLNRDPLPVNRSKKHITVGTPLVLSSHPNGLPTKVATGARVMRSEYDAFFVANPDSYHSSSGGAVIHAYTGKIEGVLVRGEEDWIQDPYKKCFRSRRCVEDHCNGEDITRASSFSAWIPENAEDRNEN